MNNSSLGAPRSASAHGMTKAVCLYMFVSVQIRVHVHVDVRVGRSVLAERMHSHARCMCAVCVSEIRRGLAANVAVQMR